MEFNTKYYNNVATQEQRLEICQRAIELDFSFTDVIKHRVPLANYVINRAGFTEDSSIRLYFFKAGVNMLISASDFLDI